MERRPIPPDQPTLAPGGSFTIIVDLGGSSFVTPEGHTRYLGGGFLLGKSALVPEYSTDPAAARLVEDEIARRGLWEEYANALLDILDISDTDLYDNSARASWQVLRATPEQRYRAALAACGEGSV